MFNEKMLQAKEYYDNKSYEKALSIYEELITIDRIVFEKSCKFNYMWAIYKHIINSKDAFSHDKINATHKAVKYILDHSDNSQLVYQFAVMKVLKYFEKKENFEAAKIITWLDKLNPKLLSNDPREFVTENGKKIICAGNMEKWYTLKSKATYELDLYKKCIEVSKEAKKNLKKFHNNSDLWLDRNIALSSSLLGNHKVALELFKSVIKRKNDWFLYQEFGDLLLRSGDIKKALSEYVNALNTHGNDEFKINLYPKIADLLKINNPKDASLLMDFAVKIKINKSWKLNQGEQLHYESNMSHIDTVSIKLLKEEVINLAEELKWSGKEKIYGTVSKLLINGKSGFIQGNDSSYYFDFRSLTKASHIDVGTKVSFYTEVGFDKKKNRDTINAVNVCIEE